MPNSQTPETKATKYSAKEKDEETQYSYFGARYYHSDISVWLSVDPLADKYPSLSPFMYCAGNPVILVDPDGRNFEEWEVLLRKDGTIKVNWLSDKGGDNLQIVNFSKENSQGDHIQTAKPIALDVNKNDFKKALERNNLIAAQGQGGAYLKYDADYANSTRTQGSLIWYNSDGSEAARYKATSGSGNPKYYTLPAGIYTASNYRTTTDTKFMRNGIGFKVTLGPSSVWDADKGAYRTGLLIHPARYNGTQGCIGLISDDKSNILDFQNRISNYLQNNKTITLIVKY